MAVCARCRSIVAEIGALFCPACGAALTPEQAPRVEASADLELGWGRVVVGEVLGEGGMGIVRHGWLYYSPNGPKAGREPHPVAVKLLHPLLRGRPRARELFLREAAVLDRLSHPGIVRFFALAQDTAQLAIIMELVDGQSLAQVIARHTMRAPPGGLPCLPFARAWHYFSQTLGALAAIHALGILHRDIKPGNVLIRNDGVVKVTDFGIARLPADEVRHSGGMAAGTGAYMSPEQVMAQDLDARSDLYAAAIVLYEMLSGVTPFDRLGRSEMMVRAAQLDEVATPISELVPGSPPVLDQLLARALAKDRALRFGSAIEMGEAIRSALGLPETAGWVAEQAFAREAQAISQLKLPATKPLGTEAAIVNAPPAESAPAPAEPASPPQSTPVMNDGRAAALRTAVMEAYRRG